MQENFNHMNSRLFCFILMTLLSTHVRSLKAQQSDRWLYTGISANAYRGDLQSKFENYTPAFHLGLKLNRKEKWNGNMNLAYGTINGQNPYPQFNTSEKTITPNMYFRTRFFTADYNLQYNLIKNEKWIVYISQGIGIMRFNPLSEDNEPLQDQLSTRSTNESYGNITINFPTKAGFIYVFKNQFGAGFEGGILNTATDYLDNISAVGTRKGGDNVLQFKFNFYIPFPFLKEQQQNKDVEK